MDIFVRSWLLASVALAVVHGGTAQSGLDPNGANVCSRSKSVVMVDGEICGRDCLSSLPPSQFAYYCCPGYLQTGRDCSIRHPCPNGMETCTDFHIGLLPKPTVTYSKNFAASNMEMVCRFDFPDWKNVSYKVEWFSRSITPIKTDTWCIPGLRASAGNDCKRRSSSILFPTDFTLGDTIWCRIFMKFSTKITNKWTKTAEESNKYYVGIEVSPNEVDVKECNIHDNITVTIRPTIPILPAMNVPGSDSVVVSVLIPQKYKGERRQAAVDKCHLKLKTQDIARGQTVSIRGVCDNQFDRKRSYSFRFKAASSSSNWKAGLQNYRMLSTKVNVGNTETKPCLSTSDPHLYTFDGGYLFYNDLGDYMMYKNKDTKVEVHVRLWKCSDEVSCACGAAIREGKHVIEISMCNKNNQVGTTVLRTVKRSPGKLPRGLEVTRKINGQSLDQEVTLLSGTRISVHRSGKSLDVRVNAPEPKNENTLSGLCGNFNGASRDDFYVWKDGKVISREKKAFIRHWRLKPDESLFEIGLEGSVDDREEKMEKSCFCSVEGESNKEEKCDYNANLFTRMDSTRTEVITTQLNDQSTLSKKRSANNHLYTDDIIDHVERSYSVDDPQVQQAINRIRSKRSLKTVMSIDAAKKYCKQHIEESEAGSTCKGISRKNIRSAINQCTKDLQFTGDKSFAVLSFDSMKYVCEDIALKNLSSYTPTRSGNLVLRKEVTKELCPSDCSGHGRCSYRTCICDKGFTALDCSMEVQAVPELLGIYNGGLCDVRERPCKKTNLLGQKFIDSSNLTCHVKEFKVFPSSWSPRRGAFTTYGKMNDIFGVKCDLPEPPTKLGDYDHEGTPAAGVLVSVSNDGFRTSSQELRQITYDSKCMTCNKAGRCQRIPNSCLIRGHCFAANEPNPRDWCQQCLPRDDQNAWTPRKNNQAPRFGRKPITYNALRGEDLVLQLRATDPDNRPVMYSVLSSTASGYTFNRAGLLRGKVTSNEKFSFKVTDECGAFDTTDMRLRIVQCPCLNGGQCVPHPYYPRGSGRYQCKCVNGFSGARCEKTGPQPTRPAKPTTPAKPTPKPTRPKPRPTIIPKPGEKAPSAAPRIRSLFAVNQHTISISWSPIPQYKRNGVILGYKVYYRKLAVNRRINYNWNAFTTPDGGMTSTTITGLQSYTEYCIKMSAFTSQGEYPNWQRRHCYFVKTPSLPIRVSGQPLSNTRILLSFQKPRRGPLTRRVQVEYGKQKDRLNMKTACPAATCTIKNLEPDTMYYFKVIGYVYQRGETPSFTQARTPA